MRLTGWGRKPAVDAEVFAPYSIPDLRSRFPRARFRGIPRGNGRSYGDSALAPQVLSSRRLDRFLAFDAETGVLRCEAGVLLADILDVFVPRGWFLHATPGTKLISVGGAIASDVHGKSHHLEGCFSRHVERFSLMLADGGMVDCSKTQHADLFRATCGGMGLTGFILEATLRLKPIRSAYLRETTFKADDLDHALSLFAEQSGAPYSVAWIDCLATGPRLGRSLLMTGDFIDDGRLHGTAKTPLSVPVDTPGFALNRYSVTAFNALYYHRVRGRQRERVVHFDPFFYPLDGIGHWNRIYGKSGFTQYQFVIPKASGAAGIEEVLQRIAASKRGSFLAVLKTFGPANGNPLSFPMEGYTLALDFRLEPGLLPFLEELDRIVLDHGGRLYLTKDVRMSAETFRAGYPRWKEFQDLRRKYGADTTFRSLQSERLGL
ncbi:MULTISPECIES: FAD-binding oxidoreductase [Methylococcus]|uniref:Decaprenylphospho-beta-D-ribofuranose 2-oxidase n=1 Tax=Methylococcus capsulatus TaxID=414 RepID=A0AA35V676_METCP|nr:FAD-binding oxidoreductase [Methylococcus capsulatus]QXP91780.1 FAD-binding oxidoreductase [Methylococcus capsulatus]CAI8825013.1 decaprenylphospho-beta-D-ribofuranose 2-oxidase [Methylococcus capsulatus]